MRVPGKNSSLACAWWQGVVSQAMHTPTMGLEGLAPSGNVCAAKQSGQISPDGAWSCARR
ncbi:hypothetical protein DEO72_LG10g1488 [Vigna unguiculata]|uniref:Uncharacterized protein n=1 Tax=Vigna unguiculata TaxID=3917 RepID=A0A4D6N8V0_VIGUN|nr:hypothetical protein DEO72_LG10g1488 [Vigna unguiculata]